MIYKPDKYINLTNAAMKNKFYTCLNEPISVPENVFNYEGERF